MIGAYTDRQSINSVNYDAHFPGADSLRAVIKRNHAIADSSKDDNIQTAAENTETHALESTTLFIRHSSIVIVPSKRYKRNIARCRMLQLIASGDGSKNTVRKNAQFLAPPYICNMKARKTTTESMERHLIRDPKWRGRLSALGLFVVSQLRFS